MQRLLTDKLGEQVTSQNPDRSCRNQGQGGRQKNGKFVVCLVCGKEHCGELGLVSKFSQKNGNKNCEEYFRIHPGLANVMEWDQYLSGFCSRPIKVIKLLSLL